MNLPGFTAEASLNNHAEETQAHWTKPAFGRPASGVVPQLGFGFGGDPDYGGYLRCIQNGGSDLICRFLGGLPPFTIGHGLRI